MDDLEDDLGIDLTPLIDVIFMLVIFFIMTTTFALPVIELQLPESDTSQHQEIQNDVLTLTITKEGQFICNRETISLKMAEDLLSEGSFSGIVLNIDAKAPAEFLVIAADLARKYTAGSLIINTQIVDD